MGGAIISESGGGIIPLQGGGIIPELGGGFLRNQQIGSVAVIQGDMRQPDSVALSALACLLPDDPYRRRQLTDGTISDQLRWAYGLSVNMIQINAHALQSAMVTTGKLAKYPFRGSAPKAGVHTSHAGLSLSGRRYIVTGPTAPPRMRCSAERDSREVRNFAGR